MLVVIGVVGGGISSILVQVFKIYINIYLIYLNHTTEHLRGFGQSVPKTPGGEFEVEPRSGHPGWPRLRLTYAVVPHLKYLAQKG